MMDMSENSHPCASKTRSVLRELNASSKDIEASAAITTDGFIIGSVLDNGVDEDRFAAMCASLLALAGQAATEISRGQMKQVIIDGTTGLMILAYAGDDAVLAVASKPTANLGMVIIESRKSAAKIKELLERHASGGVV